MLVVAYHFVLACRWACWAGWTQTPALGRTQCQSHWRTHSLSLQFFLLLSVYSALSESLMASVQKVDKLINFVYKAPVLHNISFDVIQVLNLWSFWVQFMQICCTVRVRLLITDTVHSDVFCTIIFSGSKAYTKYTHFLWIRINFLKQKF